MRPIALLAPSAPPPATHCMGSRMRTSMSAG